MILQHYVITHRTAGRSGRELLEIRAQTQQVFDKVIRPVARRLPNPWRTRKPLQPGERLAIHFNARPKDIAAVMREVRSRDVYVHPLTSVHRPVPTDDASRARRRLERYAVKALSRLKLRRRSWEKIFGHNGHARGGDWALSLRAEESAPNTSLTLDWVLRTGPLGWWQRVCGVKKFDPMCGAGINIGVIDTGVASHSALAGTRIHPVGAVVNGIVSSNPLDADDVDTGIWHGTKICGIIGAIPVHPDDFAGFAPGANVHVVRVFAPGRATNIDDIAKAIDWLSTRTPQADIINISIGAFGLHPGEIQVLETAVQRAAANGTLCVAGSGDSGQPKIEYPAAVDGVVAVGQVGFLDLGAGEQYHGEPELLATLGTPDMFVADASNHGSGLTCVGPGLKIVSTIGGDSGLDGYAADSGTSLASACISGLLAGKLAQSPVYLQMPRDATRTSRAWDILLDNARDLGIKPEFQGAGLPQA